MSTDTESQILMFIFIQNIVTKIQKYYTANLGSHFRTEDFNSWLGLYSKIKLHNCTLIYVLPFFLEAC